MTSEAGSKWLPPIPAIKLGVLVALTIGVPVAALAFWVSPVSAVGFAVSVPVGLLAGIRAERSVAWNVIWVVALAAMAGVWAAGHAVWAAIVVGGIGLLVWPAHRFGVAGAVAMSSAVAAVTVVLAEGSHPILGGLLAMAGASWGVMVVTRFVTPVPTAPIDPNVAMVHGIAMAVAAGAAAGLAVWVGFGHGYWLVVAIAAVLQAEITATGHFASGMVRGTVIGAAATALLALVLGPIWLVPIGVVAMVATVAYAVTGDYPKQALTTTIAIVALGSTASSGDTFGYALERVGLIVGGVAVVLLVNAVAGRWLVAEGGAR